VENTLTLGGGQKENDVENQMDREDNIDRQKAEKKVREKTGHSDVWKTTREHRIDRE
jgi:hypothetical protein